MEETIDICSKCKCEPQDILMLACNHDLCLPCSAYCLTHQKGVSPNELKCQMCGTITTLDESSVVELQRIAKVSI